MPSDHSVKKLLRSLLGARVLRRRAALGKLRAALLAAQKNQADLQRDHATQRRDLQYMHKLLVRLSNSLNHIYSHDLIQARGMKLLMQYYRVRDHWLPIGTRRRLALERFIGVFRLDQMRSASSVDLEKLTKRPSLSDTLQQQYYHQDQLYQAWIARHEPAEAELRWQRAAVFTRRPLISIAVPVFNPPLNYLQALLTSLQAQTYPSWEVCLAVCGEDTETLLRRLAVLAKTDPRIKIKRLPENLGIAGNTNQALTLATGEYVTFMDHDDLIPPFALFEVVKAINAHPGWDMIYSDEDKLSPDGKKRFDPHFKPDFSPDSLRSYNYICHLLVLKHRLLRKLKGLRLGFDGSQDYDLILRAADATRRIGHIPKVLYHWRAHTTSTALSYHTKMYALEAAQKALRDHLKRNRVPGQVAGGMLPTTYEIRYTWRQNPRVAIIIPTKDHPEILQKCLTSIFSKTAYKNYRIYLVDTGSKEPSTFSLYRALVKRHPQIRILKKGGDFNYSVVNNFAVAHCRERLLLFLNNDMEVINPAWLGNLVEHAQRREVGAVGAKLYYPDDTIQHGGVILGLNGIAGHAHKHFPNHDPGYFFRLKIIQNFSAVTAACLMLRREVFTACGGFDEGFKLAFGDVDLCMKVREKNLSVIWTPYAELYHYESKTRGYEDNPEKQQRFKQEQDLFKKKWRQQLAAGDPCYNPNLTLFHEDFSIQAPTT